MFSAVLIFLIYFFSRFCFHFFLICTKVLKISWTSEMWKLNKFFYYFCAFPGAAVILCTFFPSICLVAFRHAQKFTTILKINLMNLVCSTCVTIHIIFAWKILATALHLADAVKAFAVDGSTTNADDCYACNLYFSFSNLIKIFLIISLSVDLISTSSGVKFYADWWITIDILFN